LSNLYTLPMERDRQDFHKHRIPPIMWLVLAAVTAAAAFYSIPRIVDTLQQSGIAQAAESAREREPVSGEGIAEAEIWLTAYDQQLQEFILTPVSAALLPGYGEPLYAVLETLLACPELGHLQEGLITLIPQETVLLGAQRRGSTVYINLSRDFLTEDPEVQRLAAEQVLRTGRGYLRAADAVILVEGEWYISTRELERETQLP
jgi:hypothetical protein